MIVSVVEYTQLLYGSDSKMFITHPDGRQEEIQLKGLFEVTGLVRPKNLKSNDEFVMKKLSELQGQGWKIEHVAMVVVPQNPNANQAGCFFTRYILTKRE